VRRTAGVDFPSGAELLSSLVAAVISWEATMNFGDAIKSGFSNYVNFSDRATRSEYWYWFLFTFICAIATYIIDLGTGVPITNPLFSLATLLPGLAVAVRRLHDLDSSGWWILLFLIPLVGAIILIVWFCTKDTPNNNYYAFNGGRGLIV
jgi:uncharacterized membrane protein YhaH (DUF805 family)